MQIIDSDIAKTMYYYNYYNLTEYDFTSPSDFYQVNNWFWEFYSHP